MNRIKFRQILKPAMRSQCGTFHYWGYINGVFISPVGKNCIVERSKAQQCTSLKDKNNVEIYEGDYMRTFQGDIVLVKWDDTEANFCLVNSVIDNLMDSIGGCEVIGNIYENPEYEQN